MAARFCTPNVTGDVCGRGACDATGTSCICVEGYEHDFIQRLHPNCFLPTTAKDVLLAAFGLLGLAAACWSLWEMYGKSRKATVLRLLRIAFAGGLLSSAYSLSLALESGHGPASILILVTMYCVLYIYGIEQLLVSMMSPIFAVSKKISYIYLRVLRAGLLLFALLYASIWISALVYRVRDDAPRFNDLVTASILIVGTQAIFVLVLVEFAVRELVKTIDAATSLAMQPRQLSKEPSQSFTIRSQNRAVLRYRFQAENVAKRVGVLCSGVASAATVLVVCDFVLNIYPYRWILFFIILSGFAGFSIILILYSRKSSAYKKSSSKRRDTRTSKEHHELGSYGSFAGSLALAPGSFADNNGADQ